MEARWKMEMGERRGYKRGKVIKERKMCRREES